MSELDNAQLVDEERRRAYTLPPRSLALTVTTTEPIVTREMTVENAWID